MPKQSSDLPTKLQKLRGVQFSPEGFEQSWRKMFESYPGTTDRDEIVKAGLENGRRLNHYPIFFESLPASEERSNLANRNFAKHLRTTKLFAAAIGNINRQDELNYWFFLQSRKVWEKLSRSDELLQEIDSNIERLTVQIPLETETTNKGIPATRHNESRKDDDKSGSQSQSLSSETKTQKAKPRISTGAKNHTGIPSVPPNDFEQYQKESEAYSHLPEVFQFRSEFPYPRYKMLNFNSSWSKVTTFAEGLPVQTGIQFFTLYARALNSIANDSKDDSWRTNVELALEFTVELRKGNETRQADEKKSPPPRRPEFELPNPDDIINIKVDPREQPKWKLELMRARKANAPKQPAPTPGLYSIDLFEMGMRDLERELEFFNQQDNATLRARIVECRDKLTWYYKDSFEESDGSSIYNGTIPGAVVYKQNSGLEIFTFYCRFSDVAFWQRYEASERRWSSWKPGPCFIPALADKWDKPENREHILVRDLINDNYEYSGLYDALLDAVVNESDFSVYLERFNWISWKGEDGKSHEGPKWEEWMKRFREKLLHIEKQHNHEIYSDFMRGYKQELNDAKTDARRLAIAEKRLEKAATLNFRKGFEPEGGGEQRMKWITDELTDEVDTSRRALGYVPLANAGLSPSYNMQSNFDARPQMHPVSVSSLTTQQDEAASRKARLKFILDSALGHDKDRVGFVEGLLLNGKEFFDGDIHVERYGELLQTGLKPFEIKSYFYSSSDEENEVLLELLVQYALQTEDFPTCGYEPEIVERVSKLLPENRRTEYLQKCKRDFVRDKPGLKRPVEMAEEIWPNDRFKRERAVQRLPIKLAFGEWCDEALKHETIIQEKIGSRQPILRKASRPRTRIRTKFENESDFRNWVESLYSERKFAMNHNDQIQWGLWNSGFSKQDGVPFVSPDFAIEQEERVHTNFQEQRDFLRWLYGEYGAGTLHKKSDSMQWAVLCKVFVQPDGSAYKPKQLSTQWVEVCSQELDREKSRNDK